MARKPKPNGDTNDVPSRHIGGVATLELWVRAGGRCAMCNDFLLEEPFLERRINLGERAHIAGWTDAPGSPRGDSAIPLPQRNEPENLLLLCLRCHKIIDDPNTKAEYPEEQLLELKRDHEGRIHHLTGMARDRDTAVLRVFGAIRGSVPEMARDAAMRTVVDGAGRYARFPLAIDRYGIEIDLSQLADPEKLQGEAYWRQGRYQIDRAMERVADGVHTKHIRHLSIFALARIPLLIYLGYALDDKVPVDLYQKHRGQDEGWKWPEDTPAAEFETILLRERRSEAGVAVVLNLSGTIPITDLHPDVAEFPVWEIRPTGAVPNPNLFRSRATLDAFVRAWQGLLSQLERSHKPAKAIHLFPAVPITAAVACGRAVMRHVQPALVVYDRVPADFMPVLTINEP